MSIKGYRSGLWIRLKRLISFLLCKVHFNSCVVFFSFLQWVLGNHAQSFLSILGVQKDSPINSSALLYNHTPFLDPSIGQYCLMLVTKNSFKNAVGEHDAAVLGRWAILMSTTALNRCGLPVSLSKRCFLAYGL